MSLPLVTVLELPTVPQLFPLDPSPLLLLGSTSHPPNPYRVPSRSVNDERRRVLSVWILPFRSDLSENLPGLFDSLLNMNQHIRCTSRV